jgi:hypothetical protein
VKPGQVANFVIWVWSTKATGKGVTVKASAGSAADVKSPTFSVCPNPDGAVCKVGTVVTGQAYELETGVRVGSGAALGEQVQLTATATGTAAGSFNDSATDVVVAASTPTPTTGSSSGTTLPPVSLPPLSGNGIAPSTNPTGLFPTVSPTTPGNQLGLPHVKPRKTVRVADDAATVPLDSRLIGGQLAGLAVLAGAVVIAIVRLSLRTPKPTEGTSDRRPTQ